jgi:uncharacterized membrane protein
MKLFFRITFFLAIVFLSVFPARADTPVVHAILFYSQSCPHCHKVITENLPPLIEIYGDQLVIAGIDTYTEVGSHLYQNAIEYFQIPQERLGVPTLIIGETVLVGSLEIPEQFPGLIDAGLANGGIDWPDWPLFQQLLESQGEIKATSEPPTETVETNQVLSTNTPVATYTADVNPEPVAATKTALIESVSTVPEKPTHTPVEVSEALENDQIEKSESQSPYISTKLDETVFNSESLTLAERFARDKMGNTISVVILIAMVFSVISVGTSVARLSGNLHPWPLWVVPVLLLIGMVVAIYMSFVEVMQVDVVCGPVGDCETVQQSSYAWLFGVLPIGVLGVIGYLAIAATWLFAFLGPAKWRSMSMILAWFLCAFGALFSIYLTFLEPFVIGATCAWCLTSAIVMHFLLWATTAPAIRAWNAYRS